MALQQPAPQPQHNADFQTIGTSFVQQYYTLFDNIDTRQQCATLYHPAACYTFEGDCKRGTEVVAKLESLPFKRVIRSLTKVDCQPTWSNGVLISVLGQLQTDDDKALPFSQVFELLSIGGSFSNGSCLIVTVEDREGMKRMATG